MTWGKMLLVYQSDRTGKANMMMDRMRYSKSNEDRPMSNWLKLDLMSGQDNTNMDNRLPMKRI